MFGSSQSGANAYAKVGVETGVVSANPHTLVVMLFEGAMVAVTAAIQHMRSGDIPAKGIAISKAIMIIDNGLRASLDKQAGGSIALNLDSLYEYMSTRLVIANAKNQQSILEEIYDLLKGLKNAWETIGTGSPSATGSPAQPQAASTQPPLPAYDALAPNTSSLVKA